MAGVKIRETDLYGPIKSFLEGQGYEVKGEVGAADVVGVRDGDELVIVELKTGFSLSLIHQGIERLAICDAVYVGVPRGRGKLFQKSLKNNKKLCRRLGLGLIIVRMKDGFVEVLVDPLPYQPRKSKRKQTRLLKEFSRLSGDPNTGGSTRNGLMTAYRQDALRCLKMLHETGPEKAAIVAKSTGVEKARRIMADNHYGWFIRVRTGIYGLSETGEGALVSYKTELNEL